ncbi:MAG: glycosyltransferase [Acidimicrobiales bacterium]
MERRALYRLRPTADRFDEETDLAFRAGREHPQPESRRRRNTIQFVALIALATSCAYLVWRAGFTLGHELWIAIPLWLLELSAAASLALFTISLWDIDSAPKPQPVRDDQFKVAVLIPTFDEPREVLLPTVAAALSLSPSHETWVLDDGRREWVRELAESLGASYLTRDERTHAKAGNLNNAISRLDVDIVAVLDADHVATADFLTRTLGYFRDPTIAVVQTPQDFYNAESFEHGRNRSWFWRQQRKVAFNEQRLFYRAIQPGKNRWDAAIWCGTDALVRVAALREVGGVAEETVTEDMHTTIRLHRRGWRTLYHNEVLAYGLAARTASEYQSQRTRWGTGAMQIVRLERPLTGRGLSLRQRFAYASTILGWFESWRSLGFVLLPLIVLFSGATPIKAPALWFALAFGAAFLSQRAALSLLSRGYAPQGMAVLFEFVRMQSNLGATLNLAGRKGHTFTVTTQQRALTRQRIRPPLLLVGLTVVTVAAWVWFGLTIAGLTPIQYHVRWTAYGAAGWAVLNAAFLVWAIALVHSDRYATERRAAVRLKIGAPAAIDGVPGRLVDVSVGGALVRSTQPPLGHLTFHTLHLAIGDEEFNIRAELRGTHVLGADGVLVMLRFLGAQDVEIGHLARALFVGEVSDTSNSALTVEPAA